MPVSKPALGELGWGEKLNAALDSMDVTVPTSAAAKALSGTYASRVAGMAPRVTPARTTPTKVATLFQSGHGFITGGTPGAATNLNDTTTYGRGTQSAKVVSNGLGSATTLGKGGMTAIDYTGRSVRLTLRAADIANIASMQFYAGTAGLANIYIWDFARAEVNSSVNFFKEGEFVSIDLSFHDATTSGTPNRASIDAYQCRITDKGGGSTVTVWWQGIEAVPESSAFTNGVVSFTFDDSEDSTYLLAKPRMDLYGYVGTSYEIVDLVGTANRHTLAQLKEMDRQGWEIAAHAYTLANHDRTNGFNDLTAAELAAELASLKAWLLDNGFARGADHFCTPKGMFNPTTLDAFRTLFASHRTVHTRTRETLRPADPMRLRVYSAPTPGSGITAANVTAQIDLAYTNKSWVIIVVHRIVASGAVNSQTNQADFNTIVDYCNTKGIAVRPVGEVLRTA